MSTRVPAWKRLGLKLKYAKADAEVEDSSHLPSVQKRRRLNIDDSAPDESPSQHINGHSHSESIRQTNAAVGLSVDIATEPQLADRTDSGSVLRKRKSVSFSDQPSPRPQVLQSNRDGALETPKTFVHGTNRSNTSHGHPADITSSAPIDHTSEDVQSTEGPEHVKKSQPMKFKVKTGKGRVVANTSGKKPTAALDYLVQHREDRQSWKFNKNRDIWILNHAHDEEAIPRLHDVALGGYVHGLPEKAASRNRLVAECKKNLESTGVSIGISEVERLRKQFQNTLQANDTSQVDADLQDQVKAIPRSLLLLWALGMDEPLVQPKPRANKKSRTSTPIDLSSSDPSDTESDTSSSSSGSYATEKVKLERRARRMDGSTSGSSSGAEEDTSSSGSNTSSDSS